MIQGTKETSFSHLWLLGVGANFWQAFLVGVTR